MAEFPDFTPEQRERLRARARAARERARELIASSASAVRVSSSRFTESELQLALAQRTLDDLRASVGEYASLLRHLEAPPEEAVVEIKSVVRNAAISPGPAADAMMSMVVRWAVDAYYAA